LSALKLCRKRHLGVIKMVLSRRVRGFATALRGAFIGILLIGLMPLAAQVATADILGTVTDSAGAVVSGASVRLENAETKEARTFTTEQTGEYTFSALQPGTYSLTVTSATFKASTTSNIVLLASDRVRIDAKLQPGDINERVEVSATPSSLQTDSVTVGSTITEKTLEDAPLNGRNDFGLVQLQAGGVPPVDKRQLDKESIWDEARSTSLSRW
jgi:hypothetical protein